MIEKKNVSLDLWSVIAVCYPLGMMPKAPGTWGSILGLPLAVIGYYWGEALVPDFPWLSVLGLLVLLTPLSYVAIKVTEMRWQTHDDSRIVIDEVVGQLLVFLFCPPTLFNLVVGFLLFRLFDIVKPGPVGWADRELPGAYGTLLDDVIAGLLGGGLLYLINSLGYY